MSKPEAIFVLMAMAAFCWEYISLARSFRRVSQEADKCLSLAERAVRERDNAIEDLEAAELEMEELRKTNLEVIRWFGAYPSPFQKPFTSARSGMGISRESAQ